MVQRQSYAAEPRVVVDWLSVVCVGLDYFLFSGKAWGMTEKV